MIEGRRERGREKGGEEEVKRVDDVGKNGGKGDGERHIGGTEYK